MKWSDDEVSEGLKKVTILSKKYRDIYWTKDWYGKIVRKKLPWTRAIRGEVRLYNK